jgi:hypothetical protein
LLSSGEIRSIARKAVLIGNRSLSPLAEKLKNEFRLPLWAPWAVVLDARGRVLGSWRLELAAPGCTEESKDRYAALVACRLEETLARTTTLEEVRDLWERHPLEASRVRDYLHRLEEMDANASAGKVIATALAARPLPEETRKVVRFASFRLRFREISEDQDSSRWKRETVEEGERLMFDYPDAPEADGITKRIFQVQSHHTFDVPLKSQASIDRLLQGLPGHRKQEHLLARIREWIDVREKWLADRMQSLRSGLPGEGPQGTLPPRDAMAIWLGDAEATIAICSRPSTRKMFPREAADWLAEAQEKLTSRKP